MTIPEGGAEGMIVTLGGRFGGYGLYLLNGKPVFDYNFLALKQTRWEGGFAADDCSASLCAPGKHTIVFDFKYDGPGLAKGGDRRAFGRRPRILQKDHRAYDPAADVDR